MKKLMCAIVLSIGFTTNASASSYDNWCHTNVVEVVRKLDRMWPWQKAAYVREYKENYETQVEEAVIDVSATKLGEPESKALFYLVSEYDAGMFDYAVDIVSREMAMSSLNYTNESDIRTGMMVVLKQGRQYVRACDSYLGKNSPTN